MGTEKINLKYENDNILEERKSHLFPVLTFNYNLDKYYNGRELKRVVNYRGTLFDTAQWSKHELEGEFVYLKVTHLKSIRPIQLTYRGHKVKDEYFIERGMETVIRGFLYIVILKTINKYGAHVKNRTMIFFNLNYFSRLYNCRQKSKSP